MFSYEMIEFAGKKLKSSTTYRVFENGSISSCTIEQFFTHVMSVSKETRRDVEFLCESN